MWCLYIGEVGITGKSGKPTPRLAHLTDNIGLADCYSSENTATIEKQYIR